MLKVTYAEVKALHPCETGLKSAARKSPPTPRTPHERSEAERRADQTHG